MEYSGYIEKVGNTSFTCHFEAHKVMELEKNWKELGLADSAANVLPEPILCAYGTGTLMVRKENQRPQAGDPKFQEDLAAYRAGTLK
jgi:3-keto-5-aminohexanoate cleavage enzyme/3-aminobutyryl-CoA ammonia-lyase